MNMTLAIELRRYCGHDSRSVDGCVHCEAADALGNAPLARQSEGVSEEDVRRAWMAYTGRNRLGAAYEKDYEHMLPEERKAMLAAREVKA